MPLDRRLLPGIFIGSHAIAEGLLTRNQLRRRSYVRLVQGVYADPGLTYDHQLRARGVALLLPAGTAIGGLSAAAWHGAPVAVPRDPVTVLRPPTVLWKGPRGVRVHRSDLRPGDIEDVDGVPVTGVVRTALGRRSPWSRSAPLSPRWTPWSAARRWTCRRWPPPPMPGLGAGACSGCAGPSRWSTRAPTPHRNRASGWRSHSRGWRR
ncbi:hypothetical protein A7K94_0206970 [Modestobacter sp. VKM Ac-2676]|nr:hypothetical protein A7K94_0206970 [Modestobacter sp. VKM Ac-2676]